MYLLDTNILSEFLRRHPAPHLIKRIRSEPSDNLFTSSICVMELRMGSALRDDFDVFWERVYREILSRVKIIPIGMDEAIEAGDILANLRKTGQIIGIEDVFIAASAITHRLTVVTANVRHFKRIEALKVENWSKMPK
jgi:tRNA(fMet)-specific endonuclease VapC